MNIKTVKIIWKVINYKFNLRENTFICRYNYLSDFDLIETVEISAAQ